MEFTWEDYIEFKGRMMELELNYFIPMEIEHLNEYYKCRRSYDYFRNSQFCNYLKNKKRTSLIEKMID